jgi:hypothetical protein
MLNLKTKTFFNSKAVLDATDKATQRNLSKFGAFVRSDARHSIRLRSRASRPGEPPTNQTGTLKGLIYFSYDRRSRSVVIGPEPFSSRIAGPAVVPKVLEYGGLSIVKIKRKRQVIGRKAVAIQARPFMRPAAEKNYAELPDIWRDSIKA